MTVLPFVLALAVAAQGAPPICTDRPAKANSVCTVPKGRFQLETSAIGWSRTVVSAGRTDVVSLGAALFKYGMTSRSDVEVGFTPFTRIDAPGGGTRHRLSGIGDVVVRHKHRLTGDSAPVQVALVPFIKLPSARRGIGSGKVDGGLSVPLSVPIGAAVTATLGPEVDMVGALSTRKRYLALVNLVNLTGQVAPRLTVAGELWSRIDFAPGGKIRQASADAGFAYAISSDLQVDAGANLGLTRATADIELYAGFSMRY